MSIRYRQARLRKLAEQIAIGEITDEEDKEFLSTALLAIANGEDAEIALDVKAKRGERKSKAMSDSELHRRVALAWIDTATLPESQGGLGLTVKDAAAFIKSRVSHLASEDSLKRYWNDMKDTIDRTPILKTD
jgi:hypothetical protein